MKTILFQGDSITDAGRSRENNDDRGRGYPSLVAAKLGLEYPGEYTFINRGISGNRIVDLYARIKIDFLNLKPDYLSILIGVNDVWHDITDNPLLRNGVDVAKFEKIYDMLLCEITTALPDTKIMIFEPYVMKGTATEAAWDTFFSETKKRAYIAKKMAEKYNLPFITLQDKFEEESKTIPGTYWLPDGVHPSPYGHELIAREWIKAFEKIK